MLLESAVWGSISLAIAWASYVPYIYGMWRGRTKPHAFSWFIWGLLTGVASLAQEAGGAGPGAWANAFGTVICMGIAGYAWFRGEHTITRDDWVIFIAALLSVPLWMMTHDPLWSIVWVTLIDMLGYYSTIRKSYHKPGEEAVAAYVIGSLKHMTSILAMQRFSVATVLYPASIIVSNSTLIAVIAIRRRALALKGEA